MEFQRIFSLRQELYGQALVNLYTKWKREDKTTFILPYVETFFLFLWNNFLPKRVSLEDVDLDDDDELSMNGFQYSPGVFSKFSIT